MFDTGKAQQDWVRECAARPRHRRRGSSAAEFTLALPIFLLAMVAGVEYSWLVFVQTSLDRAVFIGARAGAGTPRNEDAAVTARSKAQRAWRGSGLHLSPTFAGHLAGRAPIEAFELVGQVPYQPMVGFAWVPTPTTLRARARLLRSEQDGPSPFAYP